MPGSTTTIAGVDEAGLGPLLGPLCVGLTVLRVPEPIDLAQPRIPDVWELLGGAVAREAKGRGTKLAVCDSKELHNPSKGIGPLEECLLPFLMNAGGRHEMPRRFGDVWKRHSLIGAEHLAAYPWYGALAGMETPRKALATKVGILANGLRASLAEAGVRVEQVGVLPVLEGEVNRLIDVHDSKSEVDFAAMCYAIRGAWEAHGDLICSCDRLGARAFYAPALDTHLRPDRIEVLEEGERRSAYRLEKEGRTLLVSFTVEADRHAFAVALSSMAAKYFREVLMEALNAWFAGHQPGLKPTKGYVTDGRRFLEDTAELRVRLGVSDERFVRKR